MNLAIKREKSSPGQWITDRFPYDFNWASRSLLFGCDLPGLRTRDYVVSTSEAEETNMPRRFVMNELLVS